MGEGLVGVIRAHIPRDRCDDEGQFVGTYCTCGDWEGDYFADGEAGPFDDHLAAAVLAWVDARLGEARWDIATEVARAGGAVQGVDGDWSAEADAALGVLRAALGLEGER